MGRPSKLTDATITKLEQAILLGATYDLAARYAGIGPSTLRAWRAEAEQARPGTLAHTLLQRLEAAEGKAAIHWLDQIERAALDGNWQAAAWKLERRYPSEYGRHVIQHDGQVHVTHAPEWVELRSAMLVALAAYPKARAQLAEVLSPADPQEHRNGHRNDTGT
jgi:hypothetical protein